MYNDNWRVNDDEYNEQINMLDEDGKRNFRENSASNPRFHSDWCSMIYPRLVLARNMLREDGVIFISIDDNEVAQLRKICDEVFGEGNFEADIIPIVNPGGRDYKQIAVTNEHLLVYSKSSNSELYEITKNITFSHLDSQGGFEFRELRNRNPKFHSGNRPNLFYPFYVNPNFSSVDGYCAVSLVKDQDFVIEVKPYNSQGKESVWRWGKSKAQENMNFNDLDKSQLLARQKVDGNWNIYEKSRVSTTKAKSVWDETEMRTENGTREVRALFEYTPFDHPKPIALLKRCVLLATSNTDLILDFFSGSATTAHAVMQLNAEDGGKRKFICVQLPEVCKEGSEAQKAGYKNICEIGKERIRRAGAKLRELRVEGGNKNEQLNLENSTLHSPSSKLNSTLHSPNSTLLDTGFRVLKLDESNYKDVYYNALEWADGKKSNGEQLDFEEYTENIKPDRTALDLLYTCLLEWGIDLNVPIVTENVEGYSVINYNNGLVYAYFKRDGDNFANEKLCRALANLSSKADWTSPKVVFNDSAFENSPVKINLFEIFKLNSPNTSVKVI